MYKIGIDMGGTFTDFVVAKDNEAPRIRVDEAQAGEQYPALRSVQSIMLAGTRSVDRMLGLRRLTMGRLDGGVDHLEDGMEFCRGLRHPAWAGVKG